MAEIHGVHGTQSANVYLAGISLPNGIFFNQVRATEGNLAGYDVLIGMDIIGAGDFAVTNANGLTWFTYRYPSRIHTCYVESDKTFIQNELAARNAGKKNKRKKLAR